MPDAEMLKDVDSIKSEALFEDLNGVEWLTVVPLPGFYALSG